MINISTVRSPPISIVTGTVHITDMDTVLSVLFFFRQAQQLQRYSMSCNSPSPICVLLHPLVTSDAIVLLSTSMNNRISHRMILVSPCSIQIVLFKHLLIARVV